MREMNTEVRALMADMLDVALTASDEQVKGGEPFATEMGLGMFELLNGCDTATLEAAKEAAVHVVSAVEAMLITNSGPEAAAAVLLRSLFGDDMPGGFSVIF